MPEDPPTPALAPEDYYFDREGLMVFTRAYHLKRGYCCESGCRHCPWGYALFLSLSPASRRPTGEGG